MTVEKLYSQRKREAEGGVPDVYVYDDLSKSLRVQILHILQDAIGPYVEEAIVVAVPSPENSNRFWFHIRRKVAEAHAKLSLSEKPFLNASQECLHYLLDCKQVDRVLDLVEFSFRFIDMELRLLNEQKRRMYQITRTASEAIDDLNEYFRRAGVGFEYSSGQINRVDSELLHNEVVQPALHFLNQPGFEGPQEEILVAFRQYQNGENEAAIVSANSAFESTLKSICDQRGWEYNKGARATDLLKIVRDERLLPINLHKSFEQLYATLNGLPELRNKLGAHGQGSKPVTTPDYMVSYALHLAASNILLLVEANNAYVP